MKQSKIDWRRAELLIRLALEEDLAAAGDVTSQAVIPDRTRAKAVIFCKEDGVCAGLEVAARVFHQVDPGLKWRPLARDGEFCPAGTELALVSGSARSLLAAERTALNFLQRLCGIATAARQYARLVTATKTIILDTRKTTPGWRNLEKYAVATGGAGNHRLGLYDRIMIKDNHRVLAGHGGRGGIKRSVAVARKKYPHLEIEVEADTLAQVREALASGADYILLDNMTDAQMRKAVKIGDGRAKLEASGGITLARIRAIAELGVDFISAGALTHSVKALDLSMEIRRGPHRRRPAGRVQV